MEACCREEDGMMCFKVWDEGGRTVKPVCCSNVVGRFILCLISSIEVKRHTLIFLVGRGILGAWPILVEKLPWLGVVSSFGPKSILTLVAKRPSEGTTT